jgi:hypothetical protein
MILLEITREEKRAALEELRQAIFQHDLWYENFNRTIICNHAPDERDVAEDVHRRWPFGKWLYGSGANRLGSHPNFSQIVAAKLFRLGGEKFLYGAPEADLTEDKEIAERLRQGLSKKEFQIEGYLPLTLNASFGLALLDSDVSAEEAIERSDKALQAAE